MLTSTLKFTFFFLVASSLSGCYYDKEELLYPGSCTTPAAPLFSVDVLPLLNSRCNSCHSTSSSSSSGGGIILDDYTEVKKQADSGKLLGAIQHASGYSAMPKNSGKIPACEIQKIQNWIASGTLNN